MTPHWYNCTSLPNITPTNRWDGNGELKGSEEECGECECMTFEGWWTEDRSVIS